MNEGRKDDCEKVRLDLIPTQPIVEVGKVFTFGAKKYGDYNWKDGIHYSRTYAACLRHLIAYWDGQDLDPESGLPHIAHAQANLMMMSDTPVKWDDRPRHLSAEDIYSDLEKIRLDHMSEA